MQAGISTACLYPQLLEDSFQQLAENGIGCTEIFFNTFSEMTADYLRCLRQVQKRYGMQVRAIHPFTSGFEPFLFFTGYERRFQDGLLAYDRYFEAAAEMGAEIVVFHGDHRNGVFDAQRYFERYVQLARRARTFGVTLAQENVARCKGGTLGFLREMCASLEDEAALVLDLKQAIRAGEDLWEMLDILGANIVHVHMSDHDAHRDCLPIGSGTLELERLVRRLDVQGFSGALMLELYRSDFNDIHDLLESHRRIEEAIFRYTIK